MPWVGPQPQGPQAFALARPQGLPPLVVAERDFPVVQIAARDLAADIESVSGQRPVLHPQVPAAGAPAVLIGTLGHSPAIDALVAGGELEVGSLRGAWESFLITTLPAVPGGRGQRLVIIGSDRRGTAYGAYELSQAIGVSPWHWWSDVTPARQPSLFVAAGTRRFGPPSVKYRGIFINDEGWGLQAWAARVHEPEHQGMGPKTYARVFELLLRLKANLLWPAMHPGTPPFNSNPRNAQLGDDYAIVMGSSHAEPMLRNNVGEWLAPPAHYNFLTHRKAVLGYWEERLRSNGRFENVYTLGMRGIHDSRMLGPQTDAERVAVLQDIFTEQRRLIEQHSARPGGRALTDLPQMFCAYKEVLTLYHQGLVVPDDVTVVWPDDNFGYMRQFTPASERQRAGGHGVYYHLSYLGAPLSYLWLNTTPPALLWQQMQQSHALGARQLWVLNVGDIKPGEIGTELFLQMAWDIDRWQLHNQADFLRTWSQRQFGRALAREIAALLQEHFRLSQHRKPEHLQWWLPRETPRRSDFSPQEAAERLRDYTVLRERSQHPAARVPQALRDAYFQLVAYPVEGAALANVRFLQGEAGNEAAARAADARLQTLHAPWNGELAGGKWRHVISMELPEGQWRSFRTVPWTMPKEAAAPSSAPTPAPSASFALEAEAYTRAQAAPGGAAWGLIEGLGRSGRGSVAVYPVTMDPVPVAEAAARAPSLHYTVRMPRAGAVTLQLQLLPTHAIQGDSLRLAVALGDAPPQAVVLPVNDGSRDWAQGVLNQVRTVSTVLQVPAAGVYTLRVYGTDAGVVLDKLVFDIDGLTPSRLGPAPPRLLHHQPRNSNPRIAHPGGGTVHRIVRLDREPVRGRHGARASDKHRRNEEPSSLHPPGVSIARP